MNQTPALATQIEFIDFHQPALVVGEYQVTARQTIGSTAPDDTRIPAITFSTNRRLVVSGERFTLQPAGVMAVFPPDSSLGDYDNVLPHVVLTRSTLPWERRPDPDSTTPAPWLYLLLLTEVDMEGRSITPQTVPLDDLLASSANGVYWPGLQLETGQTAADRVNVIDVPQSLLGQILPTPAELPYLAHVRQGVDEAGNLVDEEMALLIGNRLPARGQVNTVHLVSIEGRYNNNGFDFQGAGPADLIRLVTLKSWRFTVVDEQQTFKTLLLNLNRDHPTLRLPHNDNSQAETYLRMGFTPLPHAIRQGERTVSWYHGPLATGANPTTLSLPVQTADELTYYDRDTGLFDVSYAAAWEIGRLLALQSPVSVALYNWKRAHRQMSASEQQQRNTHLPPVNTINSAQADIPPEVENWFARLNRLEGIPFNYLLPAEQMLPAESIRFFHLDEAWISSLLDGALSIGRATTFDHAYDRDQLMHLAANRYTGATGFLMRSAVVAGWPGLLVDGYAERIDDNNFTPVHLPVSLVRMARLSDNVLLCLFGGETQTIDIHLKPEMLHFGVARNSGEPVGYHKLLRNGTSVTIPFRSEGGSRIVDMQQLALEIDAPSITSARFALEMIEGVEKVRFTRMPTS
ncbi:hypothetical protein GC175_28230 [bacterium]|nr:hypothetical protein [bacterium]